MIGEIGGDAEVKGAEFIKASKTKKPVVGFIAGRTAPPGRRMGHAGAVISGGQDTAEFKVHAMRSAGIRVADLPAALGDEMLKAHEGLTISHVPSPVARRTSIVRSRRRRSHESGADIVPVRRQCAVHRGALCALPRRPERRRRRWRTFFEALGEQKSDVLAEVRGASWAPNGARVIGAVDPDSLPPAANRNVKGNGAAVPAAIAGKSEEDIRAAAYDTSRRVPADPLLPHPRPSRGRPRSARPGAPGAASRARSDDLRLRRDRLGAAHPDLRHRWAWAKPPRCGRSWTACARPTAARSAWNTCTSPIPTRRRGSRSASSISRTAPSSPSRAARMILQRVVEAEGLERYLGVKFVGTKRFGLDGGELHDPRHRADPEARRPARHPRRRDRHAASRPPEHPRACPAQELHRAVLRVPGPLLAARGDARLGRREVPSRRLGRPRVRRHHRSIVSLSPNPSHLEAVNPVVLGKARAKQDQRGDSERSQVMAILMHGDAAFAGQGLVAESLDLSRPRRLPHRRHHPFRGQQPDRLHDPADLLALGPYCTEVAKIVQAPILHVNGDDPEAVVHVSASCHGVPPAASSATSSSTCSATGGTATTSWTSRCSPSR